ncbi:MAG: DUF2786 domain-containing protein [Methylococcales bacterium]|nr:DUF2786 domain-containing protein [Methylococcales bacterium]
MNPILEKVKKLLALANDAGASEGERDNALRMAHGLLAKHNLDMADLQKHLQQEGREDYCNETFGMVWCRRVSAAVAKLFFCKYYYGRKINGTKIKHHFVGKASNAATAALMAEYIISSILSECRKRWKHNLAPESRSFALGAARVINERVDVMIAEAKPEGSASTSLIVQNLYKTEAEANEEFIKAAGTSLTSTKVRQTSFIGSAYAAGKAHGQTIGLNTQVANKDHLRLK